MVDDLTPPDKSYGRAVWQALMTEKFWLVYWLASIAAGVWLVLSARSPGTGVVMLIAASFGVGMSVHMALVTPLVDSAMDAAKAGYDLAEALEKVVKEGAKDGPA
jgi:hypothetical protein